MTCNCPLSNQLKSERAKNTKITIDESNYCCLRSLVSDTIRNNKQENYFVLDGLNSDLLHQLLTV